MAICPVCNCKTDDLDIVKIKLPDGEIDGCSFCQRQLKVFEGEAVPTDASIRWLKAVVTKDAPQRDESVLSSLKAILEKYPDSQPEAPIQGAPQAVAYGGEMASPARKSAPSRTFADENEEIEKLHKRIDALENQIRKMKRAQRIKMIIELGTPVVMLILLLIVFFASGLYENLQTIFSLAGV